MAEKLKYRVVHEPNLFPFEERLNELAAEGYSIRHVMDDPKMFTAVMGLKSEANVEAVKKVAHSDVEDHIGANGWEVYGIYANHTLIIRRHE